MPTKKKKKTNSEQLAGSALKPTDFVDPDEIVDRFFNSVQTYLGKETIPLEEEKKKEVSKFIKEDSSRQYIEKAIDTGKFPLVTYWNAYCLYLNGADLKEIGEALGVPRETVHGWQARHGWVKSREKVKSLIQHQVEMEIVKKKILVADRLEPFIEQLETRLGSAIYGLEDKDVLKYYLQITDFYAQLKGQKKDQKEITVGPNEAFEQIILNAQTLKALPPPDSGFRAELIEPPKLEE